MLIYVDRIYADSQIILRTPDVLWKIRKLADFLYSKTLKELSMGPVENKKNKMVMIKHMPPVLCLDVVWFEVYFTVAYYSHVDRMQTIWPCTVDPYSKHLKHSETMQRFACRIIYSMFQSLWFRSTSEVLYLA